MFSRSFAKSIQSPEDVAEDIAKRAYPTNRTVRRPPATSCVERTKRAPTANTIADRDMCDGRLCECVAVQATMVNVQSGNAMRKVMAHSTTTTQSPHFITRTPHDLWHISEINYTSFLNSPLLQLQLQHQTPHQTPHHNSLHLHNPTTHFRATCSTK